MRIASISISDPLESRTAAQQRPTEKFGSRNYG